MTTVAADLGSRSTVNYFDYNATTPLRDCAREVWAEVQASQWFNPSSPYRAAAAVHARLQAARESLAGRLSVAPNRLVFNSGATEGNNTVFAHWAAHLRGDAQVGVSPTEHPSVTQGARRFFGDRIVWLDLSPEGAVDVNALARRLDGGELAAVSAMAANNETGVLNDWPRIASLCREHGVPYHCDASQWIGKLPTGGLGACDFVTGCGHKFGGPRGTGFWVLPESDAGFAGFAGGEQEGGHRAGTQDVAGILAMVAALEEADDAAGACGPAGRDAFEARLESVLPEVVFFGRGADRLWNTSCVALPEFAAPRWIRALEKRGYLVSAGSACSTGKAGISPVLAAMGVDPAAARRAIRVSGGWSANEADWLGLAEAVADSHDALKADAAVSGSQVISIGEE